MIDSRVGYLSLTLFRPLTTSAPYLACRIGRSRSTLLTAVISLDAPAARASATMLPSLTYIFFAWLFRVRSSPQFFTVTAPDAEPADPLAPLDGEELGEEQALSTMSGRASQVTARVLRLIMWFPLVSLWFRLQWLARGRL